MQTGEWRRRRLAAAVALVVTAASPAAAAPEVEGVRVLPEVPVTAADERVQPGNNSPLLVVDPDDAGFVVLVNRRDNPAFGCALHLSGDGGRSWMPVRSVPVLPPGTDRCYAPEVAFGPDGTLYYLFIGLHGAGNTPSGTFLVTSPDRGRTFGPPRRVLGPERYMVRMAIDPGVGALGRMHLVWLEARTDPPLGGLGPPPNPILSKHSDDGGLTFSRPVQVSDPARPRVVAPALAVGPDNTVHVLYYDLQDDVRDYQGLEGPVWEGRWSLVLATARDGGLRWTSVTVDDALVPPERVMLIYTMPPPALVVDTEGRLFAAWHDGRNGDWDVFLRRSADGGRTWGRLQRLNDDRAGGGSHQYLPRLAVAPKGRVDAVFYDRRNDDENLRNDTYLTSSDDGGRSFAANVRLTREGSSSQVGTRYPIPSARGLVEFGSRLALHSDPSRVLAAWTDTRNQDIDSFGQDIFATQVDLEGGGAGREAWPAAAALLVLGAGAVGWRRRGGRRVGVRAG